MLACGVNYGVAAFLIKLLTSEFGGGPGQVLTNWPITAGIVMTAYHMPSELPARE